MRRFLTVLPFVVLLAACGAKRPVDPVPPQPPPVQAMDVTTHDVRDGSPVPGAAVAIDSTNVGQTNADGYLLVPVVESGKPLTLEITAANYEPLKATFTPSPTNTRAIAVLAPVESIPPPVTIKPLRVRPNPAGSRWFETVDGELEDWRDVSAFSLLGQVLHEDLNSAEAFIDTWRALGYNSFRVAASFTLYPRGQVDPERTPGYWDGVHALTQLAAEKGVRIRWVIFMASEPWGGVWHPDRRDIWEGRVREGGERFARRFVIETRGYPNVIYEIANEPGEIGMRDSFDELVALGRELKALAPHVLLAAGSPQDEGDQRFTVAPFDFLDSHLPRHYINHESWVSTKRKTDHPQVQPHDQPTRMPFSEGEPTNFDGPIPGRSDYDQSLASAFCAAAISRITASYMTFHYDGGITGKLPSPQVQELAKAFARGLDAVPMFDTYDVWRGHWANSAFRSAPFAPSDDENEVERHVNAGNLWRVVGSRDFAVGLLEHKDFDIQRFADRPITTVHREVFGNYACGVYKQ